jgi:hypothetical protein
MHFDSKGCIDDKERQRRIFLTVQSAPPIYESEPSDSSIIDAGSQFYKKQFEREFKWKPTSEMEKAIKNAVFNPKGIPKV